MSYAAAAQTEVCPSRNQAIVIDAIGGITIRDYALAIGQLICPSNMISISRISQNRICIYLNTEAKAEELANKHKHVSINGTHLEIRLLNNKSKRILISNVQPAIANAAIEAILAQLSIQPKSKITRLKTGLNDIGYTHLLSHRRQVYVDPADADKIPQAVQLVHDDITYWIYFSCDKLSCFLCKEEGHTAKYCKSVTDQSSQRPNTANSTNSPHPVVNMDASEFNNTNISLADLTKPANVNTGEALGNLAHTNANRKRQAESTLSSSPSDLLTPKFPDHCNDGLSGNGKSKNEKEQKILPDIAIKPPVNKPPKKRSKQNVPDSIEEVSSKLQPAQDYFSTNGITPALDFNITAKFLHEAYGNSDLQAVVLNLYLTTKSITDMLNSIVNHIAEKKLKHRILRILHKFNDPEDYKSTAESSVDEFPSNKA